MRVGAVDAAYALAAAVYKLQAALSYRQLLQKLGADDRRGDFVLVNVFVYEQYVLALGFGQDVYLRASPQWRKDIVCGYCEVKRRDTHFNVVKARSYFKLPYYGVRKRPMIMQNTLGVAR